jgi:hypothetical protein
MTNNNEPECLACDHCSFDEGNGSPSRWYCLHPENPSQVAHTASFTIITRGERHDKFNNIPRKKVPKWCPFIKKNWIGF